MPDLFTVEQIDYLDKHFDDRFEGEFVHVKDCNDIQTSNEGHFKDTDFRVQRQEDFISGLKKFGWILISLLASETFLSLMNLLKSIN